MGRTWLKALNAKKKVEVKIEPIYSGASQRPVSFNVKYKIEGESWMRRKFKN